MLHVYHSTRRCLVNFRQQLTAFVLQLSVATGYLVLITCPLFVVYNLRLNACVLIVTRQTRNPHPHIKMVHQRETQLSLFFPSLLVLMTLSMLSFSVIASLLVVRTKTSSNHSQIIRYNYHTLWSHQIFNNCWSRLFLLPPYCPLYPP